MRRAVLVTVAAVAAATTSLLGAPAMQAQAPTESTTCDATAKVTFDPGMSSSLQTQLIREKGSLTNCVGGGVTGGTFRGRGIGSMTCTEGSASDPINVTWNTGETSRAFVAATTPGATSFYGTINRGKFKNELLSASFTITHQNGDCTSTPVTKERLSGTLSA